MPLTTAVLVRGILGKDYDDDLSPSLSGYIDTASAIVSRIIACAARKGITLTATEKELLERWLAAHGYKLVDRAASQEELSSGSNRGGQASATYDGKTGMGLEATMYGQYAMDIDPSGCLSAMNSRSSVRISWLGKPASEQTPIEDRN